MREQKDPVVEVLTTMQGMSDQDWHRLIDRLREIDPGFFRAPPHPVTGEPAVPNGVSAMRPPQHETGRLIDR